ncbi:argonaute/piwi family protein [Hyphomonas pacifica]|uniref:argonaute/piwi family protein n=1 Tax=Hyphomonas pacifica TaxID=1280941 RepID=UPI00055103EE|nr:Piwi domain-containing protein [Hyphomonas pacifica]
MPHTSLLLNFLPVSLSGDTRIHVGYRPYNEDVLRELREEFGESHVFKRDYQEDTISEIPVIPGAEPLSDKSTGVDLAEARWLWKPLLNAALLRLFSGSREITSDYPVSVLGNPKNNFISHANLPDWVRILPLLEFESRTLFGGKSGPQFGLVCNARTRHQVLAGCDHLIERGISPIGRYVQIDQPQRDSRLAPRGLTVGKVSSIDGDTLILEDHRKGYERVKASDARLTGNRADFDWCVNALLPGQGQATLSRAWDAMSALNQGPGRLQMINQTAEYLRTVNLEAVPGVAFEIGEWLSSTDAQFPVTETIDRPTLVFHPSGRPNDTWNERGIKDNGPHDQRTFTPKQLNIAVICQGRFEGQVDRFVGKLLDGIPDFQLRNGRKPYDDGFLSRFRLERANVQTFQANSASREAYEAACEDALKHAADNGFGWDLAIVQIEEDFKALPGPQNPYYATKAMLLRNNVAVQNIRIETMSEPDKSLVYTMNQVSLACYAKLGGRPWLLGAQQSVAHELVIGLGSHTEQQSRFDQSVRYVGITTVFSSDGGYHLSERTGVVPFEDYAKELTDTLTRTIERVRREDNWKNTDRVRLVFHAFKQIKDIEAEAIKQAVESLDLENVVFAFVHVAEHHPYLIFDQNQEGLPHWEKNRSKRKGVLGPSRGVHIKLADSESLVVFAGASELKQAAHGMPRACLLKLHRNSTFRDMTYLARQAFDFTAHSWRVMTPEPFPITIKYSDLIAERLAGLKQIETWDDDAVRFRNIGKAPWFL